MATLSYTKDQMNSRIDELQKKYDEFKSRGLKLDMSRGKPSPEQLDLTMGLLDCVNTRDGYTSKDSFDTRNYGLNDGLPEVKAIFAPILGVDESQIIVGGNSSLNMMFDFIAMAFSRGLLGQQPWALQGGVKFLCPSPGYDRHFAVTEYFGIELITVDMTPTGPDMEQVERYVSDPMVKGIWCVPVYSNPEGIIYSDDTVRRLAGLSAAAPDFCIMWDNAYSLHHLYNTDHSILNLYDEAKLRGNEDRVVMFASTSKISFPGAGVAAMAASPAIIAEVRRRMSFQTIGYDKINMLRHARFFRDFEGVLSHMKLHAAVLRPRFETVLKTLETNLGGKGIAEWNSPQGGYFISINLLDGCAKETVRLLKEAGVVMTPAGATYPYGKDPRDRNIRIAPTYPPLAELQLAIELFCITAELVCLKTYLNR
ncbi:MAG: aminotransferase class I/II-fold pyridoxal phosphate-dependent enzyme [Oscillospiraceae bacterium]|nr:aminotransferase class I/II-fold pyridoxal phosphate-dependent enzyme [Oscillospiraceae bacterium]MDD4413365.1 aminotransferase class I/II-fold pyridoxal phosphate-dependent enzyme [Oscillospiraceae bacterium]